MYKAQKNPIQKSVPLQENVPAKKDLLVINVQVSGISIYLCEILRKNGMWNKAF